MPPVTLVRQISEDLCGAAAAQTVLTGFGGATTNAEQITLWGEIQQNTPGVKASTGAGAAPAPDCESFKGKKCEGCKPVQDEFCWCTHPRALLKTIKGRVPNGSGVQLRIFSEEEDVGPFISGSLQRGVAPAVLVQSGGHWVVIGSYDETAENGIRVLDPLNPTTPKSLGQWLGILNVVRCGVFKGKYVVIGAGEGGPTARKKPASSRRRSRRAKPGKAKRKR